MRLNWKIFRQGWVAKKGPTEAGRLRPTAPTDRTTCSVIKTILSGNGGQISMAIAELDLAMAFHAGNYNEASGRKATREYGPEFILPAVDK